MGAFQHRFLLGWINDNSPQPLMGKRWPITDISEQTISTYKAYFNTAHKLGYNGVTLWGLFADHAWKVPLRDSLEPERRRLVDQILHEADRLNLKVLYGLGVYSWGFEEIIRHDPSAARNEGRMAWGSFQPDNGVAMCYHAPSARQWMHEIIDLCVREVGTQGFGFQPADLGRCYCSACRQMSDTEYHGRVVNETAEYVRANYPNQLLGVSAWGIDLNGGANSLREMTCHLDFLTDVTDMSARQGREYRRQLTASLPCAFGSLGGPVFVPPQRWQRERWFLPHAESIGRNLRELAEDGGRAFEFFMGPLNNPQWAIMTRFVGYLLREPTAATAAILAQVMGEFCQPARATLSDDLAEWLLRVERAYFSRLESAPIGEFDFEPLKNEQAGEPVYLLRIPVHRRQEYRQEIADLAAQLPAFASECRTPELIHSIERCMASILRDLDSLPIEPGTSPR